MGVEKVVWGLYFTCLPLQHAVFFHWFVIIHICIIRYQWVFGVKSPAFLKCCVVCFGVQPSDHTTACILKMFYCPLILNKKETYDNDNNEGDNNLQLSNEVEYHMKNYADQAGIDNTLQDLHNSSYHMKAD